MVLSEAEFFEAGMTLPPDVRKHVALRLLGSVDLDQTFDLVSESWLRTDAATTFDALKADPHPGRTERGRPCASGHQVARPSLTARIALAPQAERQLDGIANFPWRVGARGGVEPACPRSSPAS